MKKLMAFFILISQIIFIQNVHSQNLTVKRYGNVRSGPGTNYPIITKLKPGDKISILTKKDSWLKVKLPNHKEGWIHKILLTKKNRNIVHNLIIKEKIMGPIVNTSPFHFRPDFTFSPDARHVAIYATKNYRDYYYIINGIKGKIYNFSLDLIFSPNSKHFAYTIEKDEQEFAVYDNIVQKPGYQRITDIYFSQDSRHFGYLANQDNKWIIIVDNKVVTQIDCFEKPILSPDLKHFCYITSNDGKKVLTLDGTQQSKPYDEISQITFSPNSERLAYCAEIDNQKFVVCDNIEGEKYDDIANIIFSPNSQHLAYIATMNNTMASGENETYVVLDQQKSKPFNQVVESSLIFSPNSKRFAYKIIENGKVCVYVDNKKIGCYDDTGKDSFSFSPDSKKFAFIAWRGFDRFIVVNGVEGKKYEQVGNPIFSPNSKSVAHVAVQSEYELVVVLKNKWQMIVWNGKESKKYFRVRFPTFSPDSKKLAYFASPNEEDSYIVVNGIEGSTIFNDWLQGGIVFDDANHFHFLAIKAGDIVLFDVYIK